MKKWNDDFYEMLVMIIALSPNRNPACIHPAEIRLVLDAFDIKAKKTPLEIKQIILMHRKQNEIQDRKDEE